MALVPRLASAQTPTPLAEWQFSAGEPLRPYVSNSVPEWRGIAAGGVVVLPEYEGSSQSRVLPSATLELRYRDLAFASTAEGLGVNIWQGKGYRVGTSLGLDLGRDESRDNALRGLGDIDPAPELKLFGERVIFPVVLRLAARRTLGRQGGWSGDLSAYLPVVSQDNFFVFMGPSITVSDKRAMSRSFGIGTAQSARSQYAVYTPGAGMRAASFGVSATYFLGDGWFLNSTAAAQRLLGGAADSPITREKNQYAVNALLGYRW